MTSRPDATDRAFFGHPRGLATLFFTESWERFSYYGMKAILLFYMYGRVSQGGLGIDSGTAKSLIAVYGASIYMAAIAGGWVSDRILGARRSTVLGGVLIMLGHISLAVPAGAAALYASMAFIVAGTGLLKPNVTSSVGDLYDRADARRDSGFSIYYMGISVGAVVAPFAVGTLGQKVNYHLGFGLAAVGMAVGLVVYVRGQRHLSDAGSRPKNPLRLAGVRRGRLAAVIALAAVLVVAVVVAAVTGRLTATLVVDLVSLLSLVLPIAYFAVMLRSRRTTPVERSRVLAYIPLFLTAVCFWVIQEQGASVLAEYADQSTDLGAFGFAMPSSWFQSVGSFVLIVLTPLFAAMWLRLARRRSGGPSTAVKFGIGVIVAGLSYLLMVVPSMQDGKSNPGWLLASLALVTVGEMCLSPIGQSATTRLAPAAFATQTMGLWLASDAAAQGISAQVVGLYDRASAGRYFGVIGAVAVALGVVVVLVSPFIRRLMRGAEPGDVENAADHPVAVAGTRGADA
ncbi:MAG TPA: peptide MFS transporter [Streptosporangiales bacterium]